MINGCFEKILSKKILSTKCNNEAQLGFKEMNIVISQL